jgi:hypothetical protein
MNDGTSVARSAGRNTGMSGGKNAGRSGMSVVRKVAISIGAGLRESTAAEPEQPFALAVQIEAPFIQGLDSRWDLQ